MVTIGNLKVDTRDVHAPPARSHIKGVRKGNQPSVRAPKRSGVKSDKRAAPRGA